MGYPLKNFGSGKFFLKLLELLKTNIDGGYPLSAVEAIIEERSVMTLLEASGIPIKTIIKQQKAQHSSNFRSKHVLGKSVIGDLIFMPFETSDSLIERMLSLSEIIKEHDFKKFTLNGDLPYPDLLIRTGGKKRLSNFLLWDLAYTELMFLDKMWPDINKTTLETVSNTHLTLPTTPYV